VGSGRVNQKLRTRRAIVDAAQQLLEERGEIPTVAEAAEAALVSRTTAYRYFPTQESLVLELSVTVDVPAIEELVGQPVGPDDALDRVLEIAGAFNQHVLADEALYRRAMRTYLDLWLAAREKDPDDSFPTVREGRRMRWFAESLAPLRATVPAATLRRMQLALCMVMGSEAIVVMRDVCRLAPEEALAVTRWAAEAIVQAGLAEAGAAYAD
jgi:AcrR family transcriptional regulator